MNDIINAEKDIKYVFNNFMRLLKEKREKLFNIVIFFNDDCLAVAYIKKHNQTDTEFMKSYQELGKNIKPKITLMMGNSQLTIAHHPTKLTSVFVHSDNKNIWDGWEEVW